MTPKIKLSDQQYQIISVLWKIEPASVRQVRDNLPHLNLAINTIATILTRLEKKGYVQTKIIGRDRLFTATISETDARLNMVGNMVATLFDGDSTELLMHLLKEGDVRKEEFERIKALLDESDNA